MPRLFCLWTVAVVMALAGGAAAQQPADDTTITRGTTADPVEPTGPEKPVLAYFLALIGSAGAMLIVCTPARKKS